MKSQTLKHIIFAGTFAIATVSFTSPLQAKESTPHTEAKETAEATPKKDTQGKNKDHDNQAHHAHWSYGGATGPSHWGDLEPGYRLCKEGKHQSPVNLTHAIPADITTPVYHYGITGLHIVNNGHSIQENVSPGQYLTVGEKRFNLLQFHFHSLSEHTIEGKHTPMEVHLVHKSPSGALLVLGFFIVEGKENQLLKPIFNNMPAKEGEYKNDKTIQIDIKKLVSFDTKFYHYSGSLTTPPGTEHVRWYIAQKPIEASKKQIDSFKELYTKDFRPVQPLNDRVIQISR